MSDDHFSSRATSEKVASNEGSVYAHSARLHRRFSHVFESPNAMHTERLFESVVAEAARGRFVLDFGCYDGWAIPALARCEPRRVLGIDISENAVRHARRKHAAIADFSVMDCHRLALADESVDTVVGRAILHHLDFDTAISEVRRVLRPDGVAVFMEPLGDNPVGKLVRMLTPKARTKDELPLTRLQVNRANRMFRESRHFFSGFISVAAGMASSFVSRDPGNAAMWLAHRVDLVLARSPLRWWMRMALLCWRK